MRLKNEKPTKIEAKDLQVGMSFRWRNRQRKWRTCTEVYSGDDDESLKGNVKIIFERGEEIVLDALHELTVKEIEVTLMRFLANEQVEYKDAANKKFSFYYQSAFMNPTLHSQYWMRWGKWRFDIREIRVLYGQSEKQPDLDAFLTTQKQFDRRIEAFIAMTNNKYILDVFLELHEARGEADYLEYEKEVIG